ncbi:MAG: hydroxyacid dehydrogenase [Thermoprotei archaeon]
MKKIVVCDSIDAAAIKALSQVFDVVDKSRVSRQELLEAIADADCVIVRSRTKVDREFLEKASKLKVIARPGVGLDNVDSSEANRRGIKLLNTPEAPTNAAAELTIGLLLALFRGIVRGDRGIRRGEWLKNELLGEELSGKTLGVIGYGRIGRQVGKLAVCLGMRVLAWDILGETINYAPATYTPLEELLSQADAVTLHVPLTPETKGFFNAEMLSKIKRGAYLVNASRGEVLDEDALYRALKEGWIRGAALDVFSSEPYTGPLTQLDNVVLTPHIGANTKEAQRKAAIQIVELITRELGG